MLHCSREALAREGMRVEGISSEDHRKSEPLYHYIIKSMLHCSREALAGEGVRVETLNSENLKEPKLLIH
jgi:hypothetical protein